MSMTAVVAQQDVRPDRRETAREIRCPACGEWVATLPARTPWVRTRCGNRRCREYGKGVTLRAATSDIAS